MRAPQLSEPKLTFPTYQVPQVSAMRGSAPPVQEVARAAGGSRAEPLDGAQRVGVTNVPTRDDFVSSVISGSSCRNSLNTTYDNSIVITIQQSVNDNCLLNTVTVPNNHNNNNIKQRKDRATVTHNNNNSSKLDDNADTTATITSIHGIPSQYNDNDETCYYTLDRLIKLSQRTRRLEQNGCNLSMLLRLCGGGESSLSTGTTGWGTPPSQQTSNNNGKLRGESLESTQLGFEDIGQKFLHQSKNYGCYIGKNDIIEIC